MSLLTREDRELIAKAHAIKARIRKENRKLRPAKVQPVAEGQRKPRVKDPAFLKFVRALPCIICELHENYQATPTQAAHVRSGYPEAGWRPTGMQERPDDKRCTPLCAEHHLDGPHAQHKGNEKAWWASFGIYPPALCNALAVAFPSTVQGEEVVRDFAAKARA